MDDIAIRSRYPRRNAYVSKRRHGIKTDTLSVKIARQFVISLLVLMIVWGIKSIDTPFTNFISDKIKSVVLIDMQIKNLYESIDKFVFKLKDSENRKGLVENTREGSLESSIPTWSEGIKFSIQMPVDGTLSSYYGERIDPLTKTLKFHRGIDIDAEKGSLIKAALPGEVIEASNEKTYGKYVKIMHENGLISVYAHCSHLLVEKSQKVNQGEVIARVGDTGAAVGAHLHFEVWNDGESIDPMSLMDIW